MKQVTIADFLTPQEISLAVKMWRESKDNYASRIAATIITPNMARINASLGQENDAMYLGYMIEYAVMQLH